VKEKTMFGIGTQELVIFLIIVLVLFGGARIPSIARSLGKSITEFKKGVQGIEDESSTPDEQEPKSNAKSQS
jgi:TatA/E family protein of Tat protein translocase